MAGMAGAALFGPVACRAASSARASLFDYLPAGQHRAITNGRSDFDCAPALQRALYETAGADSVIWVPRGLYLLTPTHILAHADRNFECRAAVRLVSGARLLGEAGATFQMTPGYSSDLSPRAMVMFGSDEAIEDIQIEGLVLDMNGRSNPISPDRANRTFNRYPQAQIFVSSLRQPSAARIDRIRIAETEFIDANGVSCIVMGQNDDPNAVLGRQWTLDRCTFRDNGMDSDDHSSVFAYAEDVSVTNCVFTNTLPFDRVGVNTAYEVHGSSQRIERSTFTNMLRGIWVANNYATVTRGTLVANNEFRTLFYGIDFFNDRVEAKPITDTRIENNRFRFDDRRINSLPRLDFKAAVQVASEFAQNDIRIRRNSVTKTGHSVTSAFLVVTGGASGSRRHDNISATDNVGDGLTFGSFLRTTQGAGLGRLEIMRNRWRALASSDSMQIAAGDVIERTVVSQPVQSLVLGGGSVEGAEDKDDPVFAVFVNTTINNLALHPIEITGINQSPLQIRGGGRIVVGTGSIR